MVDMEGIQKKNKEFDVLGPAATAAPFLEEQLFYRLLMHSKQHKAQ